jgi:MFS transporter, ACDE family, multidrug resistance protein
VISIDPRRRAIAAVTLLVARAVYAYNWYDIGGVLPLVGARFAIGTVELGIVLAGFLAGAAIFQLPAGYAAMRWGSRTTSIAGIGAMGAFALGSAFSPGWVVLTLLRFGTGAGAAFFFAPALGLVTTYYPSGRRGFMIGAYNAAFSVGSGVGLFASAYLGPIVGWSFALGLGGGLLLAATVVTAVLLPGEPTVLRVAAREVRKASTPILRSRALWAVALGGSGLWGGYYIAAQYFVAFAHSVHPTWSLALAAAAPTVLLALEVAGGPIGGWHGERSRDMRRPLIAWGLLAGVVLALVPFLPLALEVGIFAPLGFSAGVAFALLYLLPTTFPEMTPSGMALGLALVNFVQILIGCGLAVAFAAVAASVGYTGAWLFAGVATVAFLPALAYARRTPGAGLAAGVVAADRSPGPTRADGEVLTS